ncbi:MAG: hypothetical protein IKZ44_03275 [Clostridia bacterium]|nr:hypothetical protein [Clostridia bacterium]
MKQVKLSDYKPSYPKKAIKGITLAAAAFLTIGAATGCRHPEPQIMGEIAVDDPTPGIEETLPPEELQTEGIVSIDETETPEPEETEEPMLMGDVAVLDDLP